MHGRHLDSGRARQHHADEMRRAARRRGGVGGAFGMGPAPLHEVGERPDAGRHGRTDDVGQHRPGGGRDGTEIAQRIIAQRPEAVRVERDRKIRREQHDAAVGLGILDVVDRDARGAARLVLDDHRRRERNAQPLGENAGDHVGAAAGRKSDHQMERTLGRLRPGAWSGAEERRRGQQTGEHSAAGRHGASLLRVIAAAGRPP